ncbi:hypothetical protein GEV33_001701 [Tenebrio molitor]|uniref:Uncharacterized protein n=1 Tax=Tenebrio molitor TaxID=7067 RepID=A0A8J6LGL8_TENMO|nr:hypothetical protein GEV33_001701 [Tenebrio molitor]
MYDGGLLYIGYRYRDCGASSWLDSFSGGYQDVGIRSSKPVLHQRRPAAALSSVQVLVQVSKSSHPLLEHLDDHGVVQSRGCDVAKGRAFAGDRFWIGRVRPVGPSSVPFSA